MLGGERGPGGLVLMLGEERWGLGDGTNAGREKEREREGPGGQPLSAPYQRINPPGSSISPPFVCVSPPGPGVCTVREG